MINAVNVSYAQSGSSVNTNQLGMREMQQRVYEHRNAQHLLIKAPPASGKSRALMFVALDKLFNQGVRPAINVGVSVSRVGGAAQTKGMKKVSGSLRLDLAAYRDLEAFATFASDLDPASKAQLDRGARLVELLKQAENSPQTVEHQITSIWLASEGHFDNVPVVDIRRFEFELQDYLQAEAPEVFEQIKGGQQLSEESQNTLVEKTEEFKHSFQTTDGTPVVHDLDVDALSEDEIKKQTLKVKK